MPVAVSFYNDLLFLANAALELLMKPRIRIAIMQIFSIYNVKDPVLPRGLKWILPTRSCVFYFVGKRQCFNTFIIISVYSEISKYELLGLDGAGQEICYCSHRTFHLLQSP